MIPPNVAASPGFRAKELVSAAGVALILTLIFTWPLAGRFGTSGRLDSGDALYSIWNVSWVAHALTTDPTQLWNANIFYPQPGTLAYSEANLVAGVIGVPVWVLTHNPYATSNFTIVAAFLLAALAMYALVRYLTGNRWGAALAGVLYAFCSYTFSHMAHIQLLMTFGPPLVLLRMHHLVDRPNVRNAIWLGLALFVEALACGYYGLMGGFAVALGVLWFAGWTGRWRSLKFWGLVALAAVIAVALTAPFFIPYRELQQAGFERTLADAKIFRAGWRSYLASALLVYQWILPLIGSWREVLFPGALEIGLALYVITLTARRSPALSDVMPARVVGFYIIITLLAFWVSLGPDAGLYRWLFDAVPLMSLLRAPSRFGLLVTMALAILAGAGLAAFERRWTGRRRLMWLTAIVIVTLARSTVGPLQLTTAPPASRAAVWLSKLPRGAVAAFPFYGERERRHLETQYMVESATHWQPLLNGYSDFAPPEQAGDVPALVTFPSPASFEVLRKRQARYVLVHWRNYSPEAGRELRTRLSGLQGTLRLMLDDADTSLYELTPAAATVR